MGGYWFSYTKRLKMTIFWGVLPVFWGLYTAILGNTPLWHGCDAVRWWGAMMPGGGWKMMMGGLVGCVGSTRDINTRKNYLQTFVSPYSCHFPQKMHQTTPPHTWWNPPENEYVARKGIISIRKSSSSNRYFSGAMLVSRVHFLGGKAISSTPDVRVFHRKLFKNNIDDSGAEGIAQLFQSCPGIEDGRSRKMDDEGMCGGCCLGMCWRYYISQRIHVWYIYLHLP